MGWRLVKVRVCTGPTLGLTLCSWDTVWNDAAFLRFSFTPDLGGSAIERHGTQSDTPENATL